MKYELKLTKQMGKGRIYKTKGGILKIPEGEANKVFQVNYEY